MTESYLYMFVKAMAMLGVVIAVMLLLLFVLKRYMNRGGGRFGSTHSCPVKVLSTSFLGPKKSISIVEVAGEVLVLGITQENITFLTQLDRTEVLDEISKHSEQRPKQAFRFFR